MELFPSSIKDIDSRERDAEEPKGPPRNEIALRSCLEQLCAHVGIFSKI